MNQAQVLPTEKLRNLRQRGGSQVTLLLCDQHAGHDHATVPDFFPCAAENIESGEAIHQEPDGIPMPSIRRFGQKVVQAPHIKEHLFPTA